MHSGYFGKNKKKTKGFTLIELLVTITMLAIIITIIVVLIDPAEIFRKTRDTRRMADLSAIRDALTYNIVSSGGTADLDGANSSSCSDEGSKSVYVSIPAETTMYAAPTGWSWRQAVKNSLAATNGAGWVPVNFQSFSGGSPIFNLPVDPRNVISTLPGQRYFYSYACRRSDSKFELNTRFESNEFGPGGTEDKAVLDGGDVPDVYELGAASNILPSSGVY